MLNKRIISLVLSLTLLLSTFGTTNVIADTAEVTSCIKARIGMNFDSYGIGVKPDCVDPTDLGWRNGTSIATATVARGSNAVGFSKTISFDSPVREGQGPFNGTPCLIFQPNMRIDHNTNMFMIYVKTPEIGTESPDPYPPYNWAVRIDYIKIRQGDKEFDGNSWGNLVDPDIEYLSTEGTKWVSSKVDDLGTLYIPSGFEGYIKFHLDTTTAYSAWKDNGFETYNDFDLTMFNVVFGWLGADYGSYEIGGIYAITEDNNSTSLLLEGEEFPDELSKAPSAIEATALLDIDSYESGEKVADDLVEIVDGNPSSGSIDAEDITVSDMKGWNWINKDGSNLTNVTYIVDESLDQAASSLVPDREFGSWSGSYVVKSKSNDLTGPVAGKTVEKFNLQWAHVPVDKSTDTLMFYVELPDYSKSNADWALGLNGFALNDSWANMNGVCKYSYLSVDSDEWVEATMVSIGADMQAFKALPSGFKGYVRLNFNNFDYWSSIDLNSDYKLENMTFLLNSIGGECGNLIFGGIFYTLSNNANGTVMDVNGNKFILSEGQSSGSGNTEPTKLTATIGEAAVPNYKNKSIVITSPVAEGNGVNGYSPKATLKLNGEVKNGSQILMLYVECPKIPSGASTNWSFAVPQITYTQNDKTFTSKFDVAKYAYLESDGEEWKTEKSTSGSLLTLPSGFKGYIKLYLGSISTFEGTYDFSKDYVINTIDFLFNYIGGESGAFVIGNVYYITKDNKSITMKLNGGQEVAMTNIVDCMHIAQRYDFSSSEIGADAVSTGLVSVSQHEGWRPGSSHLTATFGESIDVLSDNKTICFNSPVAEGEGPNNAAPYACIWTWSKISSRCNTFMLYIEAPKFSEMSNVNWSLRLTGMSFQQDGISNWFFANFNNAEFAYLESDSNEWIKSKSDGNGTLKLPNGFKGYIKLYIDTVGEYGNWSSSVGFDASKDYQLNSLDFLFGFIGGEYGAFKVGSLYEISKESEKTLAKFNGEICEMTTYRKDNENRVKEFKEIIDDLGSIDIEDAVSVSRAENILRNTADEYKEKIDEKYLNDFKNAKAKTEKYRPSFLGVTLKPAGSEEQAIKVGSQASTAAAKSEGYTVKSCGTVFIFTADLNDKLDLTADTVKSVVVETQPENNNSECNYTAVYEIPDSSDYGKQISARTYITYYNAALDKEITVWNSVYTFSDGSESQAIQCSLLDAATYFGVSLYR